jgi:hypothetical protein
MATQPVADDMLTVLTWPDQLQAFLKRTVLVIAKTIHLLLGLEKRCIESQTFKFLWIMGHPIDNNAEHPTCQYPIIHARPYKRPEGEQPGSGERWDEESTQLNITSNAYVSAQFPHPIGRWLS